MDDDRAEVKAKLIAFLHEDTAVEVEDLDDTTSLREGLGLDSVDLVGIIMRIEGLYKIRLSHTELEAVTNVGTLLDLIHAKRAQAVESQPERRAA